MKHLKIISVFMTILFLNACQSTKTIADKLYGTSWELDYITGSRITFDGLFPDKKPQITFNKTSNKVQGNSSCNGYNAPYTLNGNNLSFGEPGPTTMMYCGEGEQAFLNIIKKVNKYNFDEDGKLILIFDDVTMMR